jgi:hypothetical protein
MNKGNKEGRSSWTLTPWGKWFAPSLLYRCSQLRMDGSLASVAQLSVLVPRAFRCTTPLIVGAVVPR